MNEDVTFQENKPLSEYCTFGIGGPARYFLEVRTISEMQDAIKTCKKKGLPFFILGKGSNCLFDDQGFNGVVIQNKIDFIESDSGTFYVGAGYSFSLLGAQTAREGWSGLEFASGIPATVGGAVFMNAGANGGETCQTLTSVDFVDASGTLHQYPKDELHFAYRTSSFQKMQGAIVAAKFHLFPNLEARKKQIEIVQYRVKTQPYQDKSAGCVFRNPDCAHAGKLIEQFGLKGTRVGGAQVSDKHANFIINAGGATSQNVKELMELINKTIQKQANLKLESEIRFIPFQPQGSAHE